MTTTYSPGDRVRVARSTVPDTVDGVGMTGTVSRVEHQDEPDIFGETAVWVALDERLGHWDDGKAWPFHVDELEPLPTLHDSLTEAERTGGMVQITGPDWRGTFGPLQDPADIPDDPDRPVGEVIDVVPGALVRQPAGSRRPDPADVPMSSQAGLAAYVPLRRTPSTEGLMLDHTALALRRTEEAVAPSREQSDRLRAMLAETTESSIVSMDADEEGMYELGVDQGRVDGLRAARRIVEGMEAAVTLDGGDAADIDTDTLTAVVSELKTAIAAALEARP